MTKFKLNARAIGGIGLILIVVMLLAPLYAGLIETGFITDIPTNLIQVEEGVRHTFPSSQATVVLLTLMVVAFLALIYLFRVKRRRERS